MKRFFGFLTSSLVGGLLVIAVIFTIQTNKQHPVFQQVSQEQNNNQEPNYILASQTPVPQVGNIDLTIAAENSVHAVVHIMTEYERKSNVYDYFFRDFFGSPQYQNQQMLVASGSGVIFSQDGYIVTNNHVVQDASRIEVTLNDKRTYNAKIVGTDPSSDLAVIKIEEKNLPTIPFGSADNVKVGEWVLAVGNPFNLTSTVTAGIVSAKARNIHILPDPAGGSALESFIQTDAAVNPGNSGGALVNARGELIGVNAAIASGTGYYTGYSFAIPVSIVKKITHDLIKFGEVQRAILGVTIRELDSQLAKEMEIEGLNGVYVAGLSDKGSARAAGLKKGDVILAIDNVLVNSTSELMENISQHNPGENVEVKVNRNGKSHVYTVTLQSLNDPANGSLTVETSASSENNVLGVTLENLSAAELSQLDLNYGVRVKKLYKGKLSTAGIKEGFIITKIDNDAIKSVDDFNSVIHNKTGGVLMEGVYPNGVKAYYGFGL